MVQRGPVLFARRWLLCLVAVGLAGAWLAYSLSVAPPPDRGEIRAGEDPKEAWPMVKEPVAQLAGRAERPEGGSAGDSGSEEQQPLRLRGTVTSRDGRPLFRALVYVLPKSVRGLRDPTLVPNVSSDESGSFELPVRTLDGQWVGAIADGYLPSFLDGDSVKLDDRASFVLDLGGLVEVIAHDDHGDLARTTHVRVETAEGQDSAPIPAPGTIADVVAFGNTGTKGRAMVRVGTTGAVIVRASCYGYYSSPPSVRLERPIGTARFTLEQSCGLHIRVVDAASGLPLAGSFAFEVLHGDTGKIVNGAAATSPYGECELRDRLPPGSYTVRVHMPGRVEWMKKDVSLPEPGKRVTLVARMETDPMVGDLVLAVPAFREYVRETDKVHHSPTLVMRKSGHRGEKWEFLGAPSSGDGRGTFNVKALAAGTYDFLVYFPSLDRVGAIRDLTVLAGSVSHADVVLHAGLRVPLSAFLKIDDRLIGLTLKSAGWEELPIVRMVTNGFSLYESDLPSTLETLGPYPVQEVSIEATLTGETLPKSHVVTAD